MELISRRAGEIDLALICIGGHYTMDRFDAVEAAKADRRARGDPLPLRHVPVIETDVQAFKADVEADTSSQVVVLAPGETHSP